MKAYSWFCWAALAWSVLGTGSCDVLDNFAKRYRLQVAVAGQSYLLGTGIEGSTVRTEADLLPLSGDTVAITYRSVFASTNSPQTYQICFGRYFVGPYAQELSVFHGRFALGAHVFASTPDGTGIRIRWTDPGGTFWDSSLGPQTDGFFELQSSENEDDYWEKEKAKRHELKGRFRCALYNAAGGKKTVDEAVFNCFVESAR
jgi:hypothetical protein